MSSTIVARIHHQLTLRKVRQQAPASSSLVRSRMRFMAAGVSEQQSGTTRFNKGQVRRVCDPGVFDILRHLPNLAWTCMGCKGHALSGSATKRYWPVAPPRLPGPGSQRLHCTGTPRLYRNVCCLKLKVKVMKAMQWQLLRDTGAFRSHKSKGFKGIVARSRIAQPYLAHRSKLVQVD